MDITTIYIYLWLMKYPTQNSSDLQNHPRRCDPFEPLWMAALYWAYLMKSPSHGFRHRLFMVGGYEKNPWYFQYMFIYGYNIWMDTFIDLLYGKPNKHHLPIINQPPLGSFTIHGDSPLNHHQIPHNMDLNATKSHKSLYYIILHPYEFPLSSNSPNESY